MSALRLIGNRHDTIPYRNRDLVEMEARYICRIVKLKRLLLT